MPFPVISKQDILQSLKSVGVVAGDQIYVASFTPILGITEKLLPETISALQEAIGPSGTLIMPAFNWDYCKTGFFHHTETPSQVGILTEAFRKSAGVERTVTPPWNTFCVWGKQASAINQIKGHCAFGNDSVPQYLVDHNVKFLLLGCNYNDGCILVHWLEEKFRVPYRNFKKFTGKVQLKDSLIDDESTMYARDFLINPILDSSPLTTVFDATLAVKKVRLGLGTVRCFSSLDYIQFMTPYLEKDLICLLTPDSRVRFEKRNSKKDEA